MNYFVFIRLGQCGGTTCQVYQTCINNVCGCESSCDDDYEPVCADTTGSGTSLKTFPNECQMRREACNSGREYYISKQGPCDSLGIVYYRYFVYFYTDTKHFAKSFVGCRTLLLNAFEHSEHSTKIHIVYRNKIYILMYRLSLY